MVSGRASVKSLVFGFELGFFTKWLRFSVGLLRFSIRVPSPRRAKLPRVKFGSLGSQGRASVRVLGGSVFRRAALVFRQWGFGSRSAKLETKKESSVIKTESSVIKKRSSVIKKQGSVIKKRKLRDQRRSSGIKKRSSVI